jgi:hypothetical protein
MLVTSLKTRPYLLTTSRSVYRVSRAIRDMDGNRQSQSHHQTHRYQPTASQVCTPARSPGCEARSARGSAESAARDARLAPQVVQMGVGLATRASRTHLGGDRRAEAELRAALRGHGGRRGPHGGSLCVRLRREPSQA